jgi:hypothetical protein
MGAIACVSVPTVEKFGAVSAPLRPMMDDITIFALGVIRLPDDEKRF